MMMKSARLACIGVIVAGIGAGHAESARAADRFEVTSIKAVRPTLVDTANALQKGNVKAAKDAFAAFDSAWNGIEVYINTRDMEMYNALERVMQAKLTAGLNAPDANAQDLLAQAKAMLAKFDEAIAMVEKGAPLNPLYDDVARLRIERAHLREVNPALKAGDLAKARKSFAKFEEQWDGIEDLVKVRSREAYDAIEDGTDKIAQALKPTAPDLDRVTTLVSGVMDKYNAVVGQVTKEARGR
jgi:tetratricopeptide (TPR) repeat protein